MSIRNPKNARQKGITRKRRRRRALHREATKEIREVYNEKMRALGHPGWTHPSNSMFHDLTVYELYAERRGQTFGIPGTFRLPPSSMS